MKIPKSLKLPRKLKKEVKKGITRNVLPYRNIGFSSYLGLSQTHITVSYSGSNTKAFRRLCKYARKEEKRTYEKMAKDIIASMNFNLDDDVEDMLMGQMVFPITNKQTMDNDCIVPEFWKDPTIQSRYIACFDPALGDDYSIDIIERSVSYQPVNPVTIVNPENIL